MRSTLIKSATIISMDAGIGDLHTGDVLVENGRIAELRPDIDLGSGAVETEVVGGRGRIIIPGLINAHMHTWQTALRGRYVRNEKC
jgi:cytosine/adenosine deaminase-related metal-dependent hydrolase